MDFSEAVLAERVEELDCFPRDVVGMEVGSEVDDLANMLERLRAGRGL